MSNIGKKKNVRVSLSTSLFPHNLTYSTPTPLLSFLPPVMATKVAAEEVQLLPSTVETDVLST